MTETSPVLCQLCRRPAETGFCEDTVECYFLARRRLGMSVSRCLDAKASDLEREANNTRERAERLAASAFEPASAKYREHLASAAWRVFREDVLREVRFRCEACSIFCHDLTIHHLTYERLGRERREDVIALCPACHREHDTERRLQKVS